MRTLGIIAYTHSVCELDVKFLENIRDEICEGYDAFMRVAEVVKRYPSKEKQVSHPLVWVNECCMVNDYDRLFTRFPPC